MLASSLEKRIKYDNWMGWIRSKVNYLNENVRYTKICTSQYLDPIYAVSLTHDISQISNVTIGFGAWERLIVFA